MKKRILGVLKIFAFIAILFVVFIAGPAKALDLGSNSFFVDGDSISESLSMLILGVGLIGMAVVGRKLLKKS